MAAPAQFNTLFSGLLYGYNRHEEMALVAICWLAKGSIDEKREHRRIEESSERLP